MANPPMLTPEQRQRGAREGRRRAPSARGGEGQAEDRFADSRASSSTQADRGDESGDMLAKLKVVSVLESLPGVGKVNATRLMPRARHHREPPARRGGPEPARAAAPRGRGRRLPPGAAERPTQAGWGHPIAQGILLVLAGTSGAGQGNGRPAAPGARPGARGGRSRGRRGPAGPTRPRASTTTSSAREEFERLRDAGGFLEWFEVYGDLKGTPRAVRRRRARRRPRRACSRSTSRARSRSGAVAPRRPARVRPGALAASEQRRRLEARGSDDPGVDRAPARPGRGRGGASAPERVRRGRRERRRRSGRGRGRCYPGHPPRGPLLSRGRPVLRFSCSRPDPELRSPMAERRASLMEPRIEQLMHEVDSKFTLVTLLADAGPGDQRLLQPAR